MNSAESSIHAGSTSNLESSNAIYAEFWQAPPRFWKPRVRELEEDEMEAIMVSPATMEPSHSNTPVNLISNRAAVPLHTNLYTLL